MHRINKNIIGVITLVIGSPLTEWAIDAEMKVNAKPKYAIVFILTEAIGSTSTKAYYIDFENTEKEIPIFFFLNY